MSVAVAGVVGLAAFTGNASALQQRLQAPAGAAHDQFGDSVAIQGRTAVVGAPGADNFNGAVYVYTRTGDVWTQTGKLTASDPSSLGDSLGNSVAIDGDTIIAGAPRAESFRGAVYTFSLTGPVNRHETAKLTADPATPGVGALGFSLAAQNGTIVSGAPNSLRSGQVTAGDVFTFDTTGPAVRHQTAELDPPAASGALAGQQVAIDGDTIVVGVPGSFSGGDVYTFAATGAAVRGPLAHFRASDPNPEYHFGNSVAIDGTTIAAGSLTASNASGAVYTFAEASPSLWTQTAKMTASDGAGLDLLGARVAIDGNRILGSATGGHGNVGVVYVFSRTGAAQRQEISQITPPDNAPDGNFGAGLAVDNGMTLVGAPTVQIGSNVEQGEAWLFFASDPTPPTTTVTLSPSSPNGTGGWYTSAVHVTVSAADNAGGTGVAATRCVLDPATPPASYNALPAGCPYLGSGADVSAEGTHTVYAASIDNAGNVETVRSVTFKIDATPPTSTITLSPASPNGANGWYTSSVSVSVSATDNTNGSGVASTRCVLDPPGAPAAYFDLPASCPYLGAGGTVTADGAHAIYVASIDAAGNAEAVRSATLKIDRTAPSVTLSSPADGAHYSVLGTLLAPARASYSCADATSGIASCTGTQPSGSALNTGLFALGTHTFTVTATDRAGNTTTVTHTYTVGLI